MFHEYLANTEDIPAAAWKESSERREAELRRRAAKRNLFKLIPSQKRKRAESLLEDIDASYVIDTGFYYRYGMKNGIRILKLLGAL